MRQLIILAAMLFLPLGHRPAAATPADQAWTTLRDLAGSWRLVQPRTEGEQKFRVQFRLISKGAAVVETFGNPAGNVTETVYHRDGDRLIATHYCAQGNQPRLTHVASATPRTMRFSFWDVTNLKSKTDSHLIRLQFNLLEPNRIERRETYLGNGTEEESVLLLERAEPATRSGAGSP